MASDSPEFDFDFGGLNLQYNQQSDNIKNEQNDDAVNGMQELADDGHDELATSLLSNDSNIIPNGRVDSQLQEPHIRFAGQELDSYQGEENGPGYERSDSDSPLIDQWHCHSNAENSSDITARNQLIAVCALCVLFMIGEAVGGVLSNSLALFTDVLHLASDLISFLISLLAMYLARKPPSKSMSFGYYRAEVIGALFSVFLIWLVTGVLCYMAIERIQKSHYKDVNPNEMLVTASVGVAFNIVMGFVLHSEVCCKSKVASFGHHGHSHGNSNHRNRHDHSYSPLIDERSDHEIELESDDPHPKHVHHKNINVRAAFIHVIGDIIQSVGVLIASFIIKFMDDPKYKLADPICTFIFSVLVIFTTVTVLRDALRIMMEGVPRDVCYRSIQQDLCSIEGVKSAHNLLIWSLTVDKNVLSVHLTIGSQNDHQDVLEKANKVLRKKYDFHQITIQVERQVLNLKCSHCRLPV